MEELPTSGPRPPTGYVPRPEPRWFSFSAGQVLGSSFRIFGTKCWILIPLSALFHIVPTWALMKSTGGARFWGGDVGPFGWLYLLETGRGLRFILTDWVLPLAFQAVVTYAVFQSLRGTPARWGPSIGRGLKRLPHALGASLLILVVILLPTYLLGRLVAGSGLAWSPGGVLFVLGVILCYLAWVSARLYVAVQAAVVEGVGPFRAFGRSSFLTRHARWKMFGLLIVVVVVPWILANFVIPRWVLQTYRDFETSGMTLFWVQQAVGVVFATLQSVTAAVAYHALREAKEGTGLDELLAVFD
jgi:hypothetical protein